MPDAVLEFYRRLSDDAIHWFLKVHHENMRKLIGAEIEALRGAGDGFILEGAALRPEYLAEWQVGAALSVCLHVEPHALRDRIHRGSNYSQQSADMKFVIDRFTERSIRENDALADAAIKHRVQLVDVTDVSDADRLAKELSSRLVASAVR